MIHTAKLTFADIFDTAVPGASPICPEGFTSTNAGDKGLECLKLKVWRHLSEPFSLEIVIFTLLRFGACLDRRQCTGLSEIWPGCKPGDSFERPYMCRINAIAV